MITLIKVGGRLEWIMPAVIQNEGFRRQVSGVRKGDVRT